MLVHRIYTKSIVDHRMCFQTFLKAESFIQTESQMGLWCEESTFLKSTFSVTIYFDGGPFWTFCWKYVAHIQYILSLEY